MIIPTILEKDQDQILNKINIIGGEIPHFQVDIVDPELFDGKTYTETGYLEDLELHSTLEIDLMVKDPIKYLDSKIKSVTKMVVNIQGDNVLDFLNISVDMGYITGISVNPSNVLEQYAHFADHLDFIQFMGVIPGGQGRKFDNTILEKIKNFKDEFSDIPIQVDGGIKMENVKDLVNSGVNSLVIGSAIFNNKDPIKEYNNFMQEFGKYE
jgi:ribulose-phosphate 3-epimerase